MKLEKLSLASVKNVLSRAELRKIMAGSGNGGGGQGGQGGGGGNGGSGGAGGGGGGQGCYGSYYGCDCQPTGLGNLGTCV